MKSYGWLLVVVLCAFVGYLLWMRGSAGVQTPEKARHVSEKELLSSPTPDDTAQEELGETHADCIWSGEAEAWLDSNRDGIHDPEESALPGIPFYIDDIYNEFYNVGSLAISDSQGEAELSVWLPGIGVIRAMRGDNVALRRVAFKRQSEVGVLGSHTLRFQRYAGGLI